jgi:hypothetical protein
MRWSAALAALALFSASQAHAQAGPRVVPPTGGAGGGCGDISYSVVLSPDGNTLSVLFDNFAVTGGASGQTAKTACDLQIPLVLPDGFSLGVYKVDYRGFARLQARQIAELDIDYGFGSSGRFKFFHRLIAGPMEDDYTYSETIGGGLMARAGCGAKAVLTLNAALTLQPARQPGETVVSLDSVDGAPVGGVVFHLDRKKCSTSKAR